MASINRFRKSLSGGISALPSHLMSRTGWEIKRVFGRSGWMSFIALVCVIAAIFTVWRSSKLIEQQKTLTTFLQTAKSAAAAKPIPESELGKTPNHLASFYAYLPPHDAIPDQLKTLVKIAEKSGVTLAQAEYKPLLEPQADFLRYQITLPVKADYLHIQNFIIGALHALPTLTLDSVVFKRELIESNEVEARIQYSLLVKKPIPKKELK